MTLKKPTITISYRVGMLSVIAPTEERKPRYTVWECRCDCGGTIMLDTRCPQRGTVTECGCVSVVKPGMLDLSRQHFGKLVCLHPYFQEEQEARRG